MFTLYAASAGVGAALALGIGFGLITGGIAIVLLVILVSLAVLIELFKDNKIQDWLERTLWGVTGDKYAVSAQGRYDPVASIEFESKQLEAALAG